MQCFNKKYFFYNSIPKRFNYRTMIENSIAALVSIYSYDTIKLVSALDRCQRLGWTSHLLLRLSFDMFFCCWKKTSQKPQTRFSFLENSSGQLKKFLKKQLLKSNSQQTNMSVLFVYQKLIKSSQTASLRNGQGFLFVFLSRLILRFYFRDEEKKIYFFAMWDNFLWKKFHRVP